MINHQQFDDPFSELNRLFVGCRNDHPVLSIDHAAHLHALKRPLNKLNGTHPAGPNGPQRLVVAEARDYNAQPLGRVDNFAPLRDLYLKIVNDQPWHGTDILFG
jgi:hypothetical protein